MQNNCSHCGGKGYINKWVRDTSGKGEHRYYACPSCQHYNPNCACDDCCKIDKLLQVNTLDRILSEG